MDWSIGDWKPGGYVILYNDTPAALVYGESRVDAYDNAEKLVECLNEQSVRL